MALATAKHSLALLPVFSLYCRGFETNNQFVCWLRLGVVEVAWIWLGCCRCLYAGYSGLVLGGSSSIGRIFRVFFGSFTNCSFCNVNSRICFHGLFALFYRAVPFFAKRLERAAEISGRAEKESHFCLYRSVQQIASCACRCFRDLYPYRSYDLAQIVDCLRQKGAFLRLALRWPLAIGSVPVGGGLEGLGRFSKTWKCCPNTGGPFAIWLPIAWSP